MAFTPNLKKRIAFNRQSWVSILVSADVPSCSFSFEALLDPTESVNLQLSGLWLVSEACFKLDVKTALDGRAPATGLVTTALDLYVK